MDDQNTLPISIFIEHKDKFGQSKSLASMPMFISLGYGILMYKEKGGHGQILRTKIVPTLYLNKNIFLTFDGDFDMLFYEIREFEKFHINTFFITGFVGVGLSISLR